MKMACTGRLARQATRSAGEGAVGREWGGGAAAGRAAAQDGSVETGSSESAAARVGIKAEWGHWQQHSSKPGSWGRGQGAGCRGRRGEGQAWGGASMCMARQTGPRVGSASGQQGGACKINKRGGGSAGGAGGSGSSRLGGWRAGGGAACGRRGRHAQQHAAGKAAHAGQGRVGAAGWSGLLLGLLCSTKVSSMPRRADLPNAPQPCRRRSPPAPAGEQWRGGTMQQVSPETQTSRGRAQALHKQAHDTSSGMQESPSSGWKKNRTKCGQRQRCRKKRQKAGRGRSM